MRAAVYVRQSLDRDNTQLAISRQREDCLKLCDQRGWEPVIYEDNSISASRSKRRPQYEQMLTDIRAGTIDAIVAWDLDRLHRQPIELEMFINLADEKRLALATVTGEVDLSTDNGRLYARIKGAVAKSEVERKSARQKRANEQRAKDGRGWGGTRAFGYELGTNVIIEDEAKLIRDAYTTILAGGSLHSIAAHWNSLDVKTAAGKQWYGNTVRQVLVNARYAAQRTYHGEIVADAQWEPIVSVDTWRAAHAILTAPGRRAARQPGRKYLLSGIMFCSKCGHTIGSGHLRGAPVYTCKRCNGLVRKQKPVDELVVKLAVAYMSRPDAADILIDSERHDIGELREQERVILEELDQLAVDYDEGNLTGRQVKIATERKEAKLAAVRSQMADANKARAFDGLLEAKDVRAWWDGLSLDRQRTILQILMGVILLPAGRGQVFNRDHLRLEWLTGND
jgi:DNA invertase Pin-like site-specific DNA recombinase